MANLPRTEDIRKARESAVSALNEAVDQIRTPLLAALGAGDLTTQAVVDAVNKAREQVSERSEKVRTAVGDVPGDLSGLRDKLDPAELRKLVDEYTEAAQKLYKKLTDAGEDRLAKFRTQPQVRKALDQLEEAIATVQDRVGDAAGDAKELAEDLFAKVTGRTRIAGEQVAKTAETVSTQAAEAIEDAGQETAGTVRKVTAKATSTARKATTPRKPAATRTTK